MSLRFVAISLVISLLALAIAASAGAALIGLYRNSMETTAQRAETVKLSGARCGRSGADGALQIVVGKATKECVYRTPVVGRDLEVAATERLLSGAPKGVQRGAFLGLDLRAGGGARYQLAVYPMQRKAQLRKVLADGSIRYLDIEKNVAAVKGVDMANALRLRAFNQASGPERGQCQLLAYVGGQLVAEAIDPDPSDLSGRASGFSVGSGGNAKGLRASVDDVVIRIPSPF